MNAEVNPILEPEDIVKITGAQQPKKQAEVLDKAGIYYWFKKDGEVVTAWHHVYNPSRIARNDAEPDFSKVM